MPRKNPTVSTRGAQHDPARRGQAKDFSQGFAPPSALTAPDRGRPNYDALSKTLASGAPEGMSDEKLSHLYSRAAGGAKAGTDNALEGLARSFGGNVSDPGYARSAANIRAGGQSEATKQMGEADIMVAEQDRAAEFQHRDQMMGLGGLEGTFQQITDNMHLGLLGDERARNNSAGDMFMGLLGDDNQRQRIFGDQAIGGQDSLMSLLTGIGAIPTDPTDPFAQVYNELLEMLGLDDGIDFGANPTWARDNPDRTGGA